MLTIKGKVVRGMGYGKKLGFPTANLDRRQYVSLKNKPKLGIWAGYGELAGKIYPAAIVIGPMDKKGLPKVEAHLLGLAQDLYGKRVSLDLKKYIRAFQVYRGEAELVKQIKKDILQIKKILK
jgi:FAD synthase